MAVIHISEAEAAKDFTSVMDRVRAGDDVQIESSSRAYVLVPVDAVVPRGRRLSEILKAFEEKESDVLLDDQFGNDLEAVIKSHENERLIDPWESF